MSDPTVTDEHGTVWTWTGEIWRSTDGREMYTEQLRDQRGPCRPAPQIIRTPAELEALDPMTVVYTPKRDTPVCAGDFLDDIRHDPDYADDLPAVKVAEGAHVRACREALEGGTT